MRSASYGWAQSTVRQLCELDPINIAFCLEPDNATRHYVGLAVRGRQRAAASSEWLAQHLARAKRRDLLSSLWGRDLGSTRLLSRCAGRTWSRGHYDDLAVALADPQRRAAIARADRVYSRDAPVFARAPLDLLDAHAIDLFGRNGVATVTYVADALARRSPGHVKTFTWAAQRTAMPSARLLEPVCRTLIDEPLPCPPWQGAPGVRPLRTLRQITAAGIELKNCLADLEIAVWALAGNVAYYVTDKPYARACACLRFDRVLGSWRLSELKGPRNKTLAPSSARQIRDTFRQAGFPYLRRNPLLGWVD